MRRSQRCSKFQILMAGACLGASACGTTRAYDGPERTRDQIAVIQPARAFDNARVIRVDGTALGFFDKSIEVVPGKHVVTLEKATGANSTAQGDVELDAKAGTVYEAHGTTTGFLQMQHWFWIVDASNQTLAGGKPPSH